MMGLVSSFSLPLCSLEDDVVSITLTPFVVHPKKEEPGSHLFRRVTMAPPVEFKPWTAMRDERTLIAVYRR